MSKSSHIGHIFQSETTKEVLKKVWDTIKKKGKEYKSQRGLIRSLKGTVLVINDPLDEKENYPYWEKEEDDWYQENFVRKESNNPPEKIFFNSDIYPYKYVWRSRYFDNGWGHIVAVISILKKLGIKKINFKNKKGLIDVLKKTYRIYHPEIVLAILSWKEHKLINFYLKNPALLNLELQTNRSDSLLSIIEELKQNPNSRRAITHSFTYEHIDHSGVAGGVPVYQNYQLYVDFNKAGKPEGLISLHLHRAMDALGGTQLDISHDREWGEIASKKLNLPLKQMVIYCNDIYYHVEDKNSHQDLVSKTNIRKWLFAVTDAYDPKEEDIEKRLASANYQKKIDYTWGKLKK